MSRQRKKMMQEQNRICTNKKFDELKARVYAKRNCPHCYGRGYIDIDHFTYVHRKNCTCIDRN